MKTNLKENFSKFIHSPSVTTVFSIIWAVAQIFVIYVVIAVLGVVAQMLVSFVIGLFTSKKEEETI